MVVEQPKFTRVEEPTLLCNQVVRGSHVLLNAARAPIYQNTG